MNDNLPFIMQIGIFRLKRNGRYYRILKCGKIFEVEPWSIRKYRMRWNEVGWNTTMIDPDDWETI